MMIHALNPCPTTTAKTAEIMSRYRPIAPKPEVPPNSTSETSSESPKIRQSPYLRTVWSHLQARPTRTRKRGRTAFAPPAIKRPRTQLFGLSPPCHISASPAKNLSMQAFSHALSGLPQVPVQNLVPLSQSSATLPQTPSNLVTLSLLTALPSLPHQSVTILEPGEANKGIDLNIVAEIPVEKDFLQQLQGPIGATSVIAPQPIRPVGSSISIGSINQELGFTQTSHQVLKKRQEVEEDVEAEALPAVVSDSNNKVRLANSAYKEMVGQPECSWLDSMVTCEGKHGGGACKRICGEVVLQFSDTSVPVSSNGFSCWVTIEWGGNGKKNRSAQAFCDVKRLSCESKDYLFAWRFHTKEASESGLNA